MADSKGGMNPIAVNIHKLSYTEISGHAEAKEIDFIKTCFDLNETGSYCISLDTLEDALERAREEKVKVPKDLVARLKRELKKNDFDIQVFQFIGLFFSSNYDYF